MRTIKFMLIALVTAACFSPAFSQEAAITFEPEINLVYKNLGVAEFQKKMNTPEVVVLDVRTPEETATGKIDGALEIDVLSSDFVTKVKQLDKSKTYLVYCRSGKRSHKACTIMAEEGFPKLYNLSGGFTAWQAAQD